MANNKNGIDYKIDYRQSKQFVLERLKMSVASRIPEFQLVNSNINLYIDDYAKDLVIRMDRDIASRINKQEVVEVKAEAHARVVIPASIWDAIKEKYIKPYFDVSVEYTKIEDKQVVTRKKTFNIRECYPTINFPPHSDKMIIIAEEINDEIRGNS